MTKNLSASVRARLLNIAKDTGVRFQEMLVRYGMERTLCRSFAFDGTNLRNAIEATCRRRETPVPESPPTAITSRFSEVTGKQSQWESFGDDLRDSNSNPSLEEVVSQLQQFLWPPTEAIGQNDDFTEAWPPGGPWE